MQSVGSKKSFVRQLFSRLKAATFLSIFFAPLAMGISNGGDATGDNEGTIISIRYYGVQDKPFPCLRILLGHEMDHCVLTATEETDAWWHIFAADKASFDIIWDFLYERQNRIDRHVDPSFKIILIRNNKVFAEFILTGYTTVKEFSELVNRLRRSRKDAANPIISIIENLQQRIR